MSGIRVCRLEEWRVSLFEPLTISDAYGWTEYNALLCMRRYVSTLYTICTSLNQTPSLYDLCRKVRVRLAAARLISKALLRNTRSTEITQTFVIRIISQVRYVRYMREPKTYKKIRHPRPPRTAPPIAYSDS
jgi:hypothetical protein